MARSHARITVEVWSDPDWQQLTPRAQWLYLMLLAHPRLTLVGTLDLFPTRWARVAATTVDDVQAALDELEDEAYIVVDRDTDELLIRSFTRHDLTPGRVNRNLAKGFWSAFTGVLSPVLRSQAVHAVPDALWDRLIDHDPPPSAVQTRRSPRLEPEPRPRFEPEPDPRSQPQDAPPFEPPPPPPPPPPSPESSLLSSQSDPLPAPVDNGDDDEHETVAGDPLGLTSRIDRAKTACAIVGTRTHDDRLAAGDVRATTPSGIDAHRRACINGATKDHLTAAIRHAQANPDWTPQRIAAELTRPAAGTVPLEQSQHPAVVLGERERARERAEAAPVASDAHVRSAADDARRALAGAPRLAVVADQ